MASIIKLYEHADFKGREVALTISANNLTNFGFNDVISSVKVVRGTWILYKDSNFQGKSYQIGPGSYGMGDISAKIGNDVVSSVQLVGKITLYEHASFKGKTLTLEKSAPNFSDLKFNDEASSIKVLSGTWILYEHANYSGRSALIGKGDYDIQAVQGLIGNDVISSVKLY